MWAIKGHLALLFLISGNNEFLLAEQNGHQS